jgi:hypothetical protein
MLRLLLDEHISSKVVLGLKRQLPLADVDGLMLGLNASTRG